MNVKPEFDTTTHESRASAFEYSAFDKSALRRDGIQIIKDFFEPEMKARFKALGERVVAGLESGEIVRSYQFAMGVDLNKEACPSDSAAFTAAAEEMFGKDIGQFYMRLVMKDAKFRSSIEVHQDYPYFGGDTNKLNVFIPITHCGRDNGMVEYYVGSHKMGPVTRGDIDIVRYPQFKGVIPELEVGDILLADFLTWHGSQESDTGAPRIMIQIVLQPLSDPSSSFRFGRPPEEWGGQVMPRHTVPMRTARPSIGILTVKEMIAYPSTDEAARMLRGLCFDSPMNVEARLLLADLIKQGHQGDNLLDGLAPHGHVNDLLESAEDGLIQIAREVDKALGRPSRLTAALTVELARQLEETNAAKETLERHLQNSRTELTQSAGELWQAREDLKAAKAEAETSARKAAEMAEELARGQAELAETRKAVSQVNSELAQTRQTLTNVMESETWKATAPVRRVLSALKKR